MTALLTNLWGAWSLTGSLLRWRRGLGAKPSLRLWAWSEAGLGLLEAGPWCCLVPNKGPGFEVASDCVVGAASGCGLLQANSWSLNFSLQQVQEKWHLVDDLSRLLPELSPEPESPRPRSRASRPRSFCPGFPCPGSPGPRTPRLGPSTRLSSSSGAPSASVPVSRFHFPSRTEMYR